MAKEFDKRNVIIKQNIERAMNLRGIPNVNQLALKLKGQVTQPSLYMLMSNPEENNPTAKTLRAIAKVLDIEAWMLLIPSFPFEALGAKPLERYTPEGYKLAEVFEALPPEKRKSILDFVVFQLHDTRPQYANAVRSIRDTPSLG